MTPAATHGMATEAAARARTIGILGGGQLGRMLVHAAQRMGFRAVVLDPDAHCPAGQAADGLLRGAYDDPAALADLARICCAVTTEFENVPASSLQVLAASVTVSPAAEAREQFGLVDLDRRRRLHAAILADPAGGRKRRELRRSWRGVLRWPIA